MRHQGHVCACALCASLTRAHEQVEGAAKAAAVRAMQAASGLYEFDYAMSKEHSDILPGAVRAAVNGKALEGEVCLNSCLPLSMSSTARLLAMRYACVNGKALGNEICMDLSSPPKP